MDEISKSKQENQMNDDDDKAITERQGNSNHSGSSGSSKNSSNAGQEKDKPSVSSAHHNDDDSGIEDMNLSKGIDNEMISDTVISNEDQSNTVDSSNVFSAYHGSTKVVASTIHAAKAKNGSHTVYTIQIKVYFDDYLDRQWEVLRRYSDYDKLHRALKECGFPCPELPPKHLWSFHTHAFIEERRNALDLWIQGTICIWQSVSPSQPAQAFEVGDLLESFLCDIDTDRFNSTVDHVLSGATTELDFGTSPQPIGGSFASLARARKKNTHDHRGSKSGNNNNNSTTKQVKVLSTIEEDDGRSILAASTHGTDLKHSSTRRTKRSNNEQNNDGLKRGHSEERLLSSSLSSEPGHNRTISESGRVDRATAAGANNNNNGINSGGISTQRALSATNLNQLDDRGLLPPLNSPNPSISTPIISRGSLFKNASTGDLDSLVRSPDADSYDGEDQNGITVVSNGNRSRRSEATTSSASATDIKALAKETTPVSKSLPSNMMDNIEQLQSKNSKRQYLPSPKGDVGVAVDSKSIDGTTPMMRNYTTFDHDGHKVTRTFKPFTTTVMYRSDSIGPSNVAGLPDASTPVSVPPTPFGQGEFFQSWAQYTNSVLDFVAQRLDRVSSKRQSILDPLDNPAPISDASNNANKSASQSGDAANASLASTNASASSSSNNNNNSNGSKESSNSPKDTGVVVSSNNNNSNSNDKHNNANDGSTAAPQSEKKRENSSADSDDQGESLFDDQFEKIQREVLSASSIAASGTATASTTTAAKTNSNEAKESESKNESNNQETKNGNAGYAKIKLQPNRTPEEEMTYRSYLSAGERLVNIILKESESAVDPLGTNWEFVANTKNVIVMQRKKPIRRGQKSSSHSTSAAAVAASSAAATSLSSSQVGEEIGSLAPTPESVMTGRSVNSNILSGEEHRMYQSEKNESTVTSTDSGRSSDIGQSKKIEASSSSSSSRQYCFMGRGVINAPASEIFEVVRRPQTRLAYDRLLKEEIILENIQTIASTETGTLSFLKLASDAGPGDAMTDLNALGSALSGSHFSLSQTNENEKQTNNTNASSSTSMSPTEKRMNSSEKERQASSSGSAAVASSSNDKSVTIDAPQDSNDDSSSIGNILVYYHLFETNRCFFRHSRDFCVLQYAKGLVSSKPNKYIVVGTSIIHPDCPTRDDVVRATIPIFGWVIESISKRQSKVSYIIQLDFGGSVSTQLLNTISFRQPLCVYYLGKYMAERASQGRPMY